MIRIYLPYVLALSEALEPLATLLPGKKQGEVVFQLWSAQAALDALLNNSVFSGSLRSSRQLAQNLLAALEKQSKEIEWDSVLTIAETFPITSGYGHFKTAFFAEIGTFPAYFVTQKGSHDTLTLLDQSWRMFPPDLGQKVPEALFDVAEAGKALCYEVPTACGFHLFRATEAVLRRYYHEATGGSAPPKVRSIGVYVKAMRIKKCGDERILSVLEQMAKLHRNPIIHPEVALTPDEAISILGIAHSAITAMLAVLPLPPPTTATALPTNP